jgi:hypothetical protein
MEGLVIILILQIITEHKAYSGIEQTSHSLKAASYKIIDIIATSQLKIFSLKASP